MATVTGKIILNDIITITSNADTLIYETPISYTRTNEGIVVPVGTSENRPLVPSEGLFRYNTSYSMPEVFMSNEWIQIPFENNILSDITPKTLGSNETTITVHGYELNENITFEFIGSTGIYHLVPTWSLVNSNMALLTKPITMTSNEDPFTLRATINNGPMYELFDILELTPYRFIHTFTNAGATGQFGPTLQQCIGAYQTNWVFDSTRFNVINGYQYWTIQYSGLYKLTIGGASGGNAIGYGSNPTPGGRGRVVSGMVYLNEGSILKMIVGQCGEDTYANPGGGGGSYIFYNTVNIQNYLFAVGGGGGATNGYNSTTSNFYPIENGLDAPDSIDGSKSSLSNYAGEPGTNGGGGGAGAPTNGYPGIGGYGIGSYGDYSYDMFYNYYAQGGGPGFGGSGTFSWVPEGTYVGGGGGGTMYPYGESQIRGANGSYTGNPLRNGGAGGYGGGGGGGVGIGFGGSGGGGGFSGGGGGKGGTDGSTAGGGGGTNYGIVLNILNYNSNVGLNPGMGFITIEFFG